MVSFYSQLRGGALLLETFGVGVKYSGAFCAFLWTRGTRTAVETWSAYRAHLLFDANNFHSESRVAALTVEDRQIVFL